MKKKNEHKIDENINSDGTQQESKMLGSSKNPLLLFLRHRPNPSRVPTFFLLLRYLTTTTINGGKPSKDDYFAAIHHISNIVRRDIYMERTLNKMRISVNSELVYRVLRSCSTSATEALRFFNWAQTHHPSYHPTTVECEELVRTLARTKKYEFMWKILNQMHTHHNLSVSPDTLCFIVEEYGRHGLVDQAVEIFNQAPKIFNCKQTVNLYNSLLFALCEVKLFHGAYALIRRMIRKGVVPDKRTYSILVNAWCSAGKFREAQQFLEEMSKKGFNPPVRGRDLLVEGLLNAGYVESAKEMVKKMIKEGFVPDVSTFNSLLEAISKHGEVEFCIDLYREVCILGLVPDINTYKVLIPGVSKVGRIDEAFRLLHDSIEDGHKPFPSLYAPIIKGMCKNGQFDDALCFFSEMKVKGHPPNRPVYTMLITMCGRGGRFVEAANYLMEMTELGLTPISRCFDLVTDGLKNCGKHDLAKKIEQLEVSLRGV
ncbi:pentatricopeptide repeat-containing protein At5g18390, mitochondrial [Ziziphus jujuba]|uniref:Pentatricopeptide repeat-containing protein At5g18390, mitochondrial n=1 Tax=Ziziphus jujuba TaxID=326968 RepID=A0A6P3ZRP3_ZIZJJ|nr:pentatricopeptide repeat-containing protein At5g18390, mitochondrial [Ziziphus jujuba]